MSSVTLWQALTLYKLFEEVCGRLTFNSGQYSSNNLGGRCLAWNRVLVTLLELQESM